MIAPLDPFSANFDSIEVNRATAPSKEAFERAIAFCAPQEEAMTTAATAAPEFEAPGFYMLDDCGGRFTVDRDMGVVSLKDQTLLDREHGAVHGVRVRVVEQSGESYELAMQLRVTGLVPQMVGAEDDALFFSGDAEAAPAFTAPTPALNVAPQPEPAPQTAPSEPETIAPWHEYAAATATLGKGLIVRPRRSLIMRAFPDITDATPATLVVGEPLPAVGSTAPWSL